MPAMNTHKEERREGYVEIPQEVVAEIRTHIQEEDKRDAQWESMFERGTKRMDEIETDLKAIGGIVAPLQGFVNTMKVASVLLAAFITLLTWVFVEKNADIKEMQKSLNVHSTQINETLTVLKLHMAQNAKEHDAMDARDVREHKR